MSRPDQVSGIETDKRPLLIYLTFANADEASRIASTIVEESLVACVNILGNATSIYRWEGKLRRDAEVVAIAKTTSAQLEQLVERIRALHSYQTPCVVALPMAGGNEIFLNWIKSQAGQGSPA